MVGPFVRVAVLCLGSAAIGASLAWGLRPAAPPPPPAPVAVAPPAPTKPAEADRQRVAEALRSGDVTALEALQADGALDPRLRAAVARKLEEARVVGTAVRPYEHARWLQGTADPAGVDLVVFWEVWCPHCQREVPKLKALADAHRADGLDVVGLTRLTRDTTEAQVRAFLDREQVGYPVAVVDEAAATALHVAGVPAAAALRDGKVIWRGHPAQIDEATVARWLKEG